MLYKELQQEKSENLKNFHKAIKRNGELLNEVIRLESIQMTANAIIDAVSIRDRSVF